MYINQIFEFSMILDYDKFQRVFRSAFGKKGYTGDNEDEYIDRSLEEKGIVVAYRDSQYKKKIKVVVNTEQLLNGSKADPDRIVRKIDKRINEYFDFKYKIEDFILSGMRLTTDINVWNRENVRSYLKVFQRIGKVKGFSKARYECFEDADNFCLNGNSNGIEFMTYDLEGLYNNRLNEADIGRKKVKEKTKDSEGILRTEVWLTKPKALRAYTESEDVSMQIVELLKECQNIFLGIFVRIIPFGNYYKKGKVEEVIRSQIEDSSLRRRMLRLVALIPEKRSLYLAQKAMNYRNMEKVMDAFAKINLSPVTISKRQNVKCLENLYSYMF